MQAECFYYRVALFKIKCEVLVFILGEQLAAFFKLCNVVDTVGNLTIGNFGIVSVFFAEL